jgi:hypothetical protein
MAGDIFQEFPERAVGIHSKPFFLDPPEKRPHRQLNDIFGVLSPGKTTT